METEGSQEFFWTATGNIVAERAYGEGGKETRSGTKHFRPGTKVNVIDWFPGMCDRIMVIGQHRKSKRLMRVIISVEHIENLRVKKSFNPGVIRLIKEHLLSPNAVVPKLEFAKTLCEVLPIWQRELKK